MVLTYYRRVRIAAPFALALIGLLLIGWSAWQFNNGLFIGVDWDRSTGVVAKVDRRGPATDQLFPGDRIVSINNAPLMGLSMSPTTRSGDQLRFLITRARDTQLVLVPLAEPPLAVRLSRQVPSLVALVFWAIGVAVLAFKPQGTQSWLFLLFCLAFSSALVCGALGAIDLPLAWAATLFQMLLWWVGPLAVHLHFFFPVTAPTYVRRRVMTTLYSVAVLGCLPNLFRSPFELRATLPLLYSLSLLWLAACLLGVVFLLVQVWRHTSAPVPRRQLGLVALGGSIAIAPFFAFLLLPFALVSRPLLPVDLAFLLMLAIPLTYGYAIVNYRLISLDRYVSRGAAFVFLIALLGGLYLAINTLLTWLVPTDMWSQPVVSMLISVGLAIVTADLYRRMQLATNQLLYGGSYDYRSAVHFVFQTLDQPTNRPALARTLCSGIQTAMQLKWVCLLGLGKDGALVIAGESSEEDSVHSEIQLLPSGTLYRFFLHHTQPIDTKRLLRMVRGMPLSACELELLNNDQACLWIPLLGMDMSEGLTGLCILGSKRGSEMFDATDLDILLVVTRLANSALQNSQLITELQLRAMESEQLHQQVIHTREEERKRVARELHDQIIQALVGINYHLSTVRARCGPDISEHIGQILAGVRQTLDDVRQICADLRPPALDSLGLVAAVRSWLRTLEQQSPLNIELELCGDTQRCVPEHIAICLYRVMQEALVNVQKHAEATDVVVKLDFQPEQIVMVVQDNGKGFSVPQQLGSLMADHHFGLVGLRERLELVKGTMSISSCPQQGTAISACVPITVA